MASTGIAILSRVALPLFMADPDAMAACHNPDYDPEWWHPTGHDERRAEAELGTLLKAKAICAGCPLQERCEEWAISTGVPFGVWGGLTSGQIAYRHRCRVGTCGHVEHQSRSTR